MEPIGGGKKKKKDKSRKSEFIQIRIPVARPGSKKYTHVDWNELLRNNGKQRDEDELKRFYDEDTLFMAKKLRETKSKSGKKIRVNLDEIQHMNRNCGYDMDDDFIDDTEAVDDTNFESKKGGFYAGKGNVKDLQDLIEEEESDDDDVIIPEMFKPRKKKIEKKIGEKPTTSGTVTSSDSEPEERPRMTGAPPSKRFRPTAPVKETTPPPGIRAIDSPVVAIKKKAPAPAPESSTSTSSDIICLDDEPPVKKKAPEVVVKKSEAKILNMSTKASSVTQMAKKICKQQEEINNKKPSQPSTLSSSKPPAVPTTPSKPDVSLLSLGSASASSQSKPSTSTSKPAVTTTELDKKTTMITTLFDKISKKGKSYKEKNLKTFDSETVKEIIQIMDVIKDLKDAKIDMGSILAPIANSFGMTTGEVMRQVTRIAEKPAEKSVEKPKKLVIVKEEKEDLKDLKFQKSDLPHMGEPEIQLMTSIVGSWRTKKQLTNSTITGWLKEVNEKKMNTDDARVSFYSLINKLPDVDGSPPQDNGIELPKHERSRKPRMFLHQWVYLSRKYVEMTLPSLKKMTTEGLALKQLTAVNAIKEGLKKQVSKYESNKSKEPTNLPFQFSYTEPILAAVAPYLEETTDYALSTRKLDTVVTAIDSLHPSISEYVTLTQFYIEICRRLQKLSFLVVEEPMKKRLFEAKEQIGKHQVVQTPKYQVKWPNGQEPSLRGLNRELHVYDKSILEICGKSPNRSSATSNISSNLPSSSTPSRPSTSSKPTTSFASTSSVSSKPTTSSTSAPSTSSKIQTNSSDDAAKRQQAMNQLVQVYLGKYIMATGNTSTAEIADSKQFPLSDEELLLLTIAVYSSGVPLPNQMLMFKNLMQNVGQARLATAVAMHKARISQKLTDKDHQKLFEFFGSLDKKIEQNKQEKINKIQEENQRKIEEKQRKEQEKAAEKQAEKDRIEAKKREEKERKEREKREEKERKDREIRENLERKRREEEDRIKARMESEQQLEDKRRKKEAEKAVEKELERRAKLETERKIAEAKRAEERENQIKMMRAQQAQRRLEDPPEPVMAPVVPPVQTEPSTSSSNFSRQPIIVKKEAVEPPVDILNAAQEAADIPIIEPNSSVKQEPAAPEKPMSAFEKLASLRGRTMSADMKRGVDVSGTQMEHVPGTNSDGTHQGGVQQPMGFVQQNSPFMASNTSNQQFFPTSSAPMTQPLQHIDQSMANQYQNPQNSLFPNQQQQNIFNSAPIPQMHQPIPRLQHQISIQNLPQNPPQLNHQAQMHLQQQQQQQQRLQHQNPNSMSSGSIFNGNGNDQREPNRRSMSMSQPQTFPQHQSPQTLQQQQFPINSYQSPIHQNNSMNNSSLMHTPHSNNSMVSQSPQFSSHPSPMSQQFHTPPSVGMLTHMNPSPMAQPNQSPLQHFNFPPASSNYSPQRGVPQQQQQQQMHRQLSQQNLMMMQQHQQIPNNQHPMHQQMHPHQLNHHNYPPQ